MMFYFCRRYQIVGSFCCWVLVQTAILKYQFTVCNAAMRSSLELLRLLVIKQILSWFLSYSLRRTFSSVFFFSLCFHPTVSVYVQSLQLHGLRSIRSKHGGRRLSRSERYLSRRQSAAVNSRCSGRLADSAYRLSLAWFGSRPGRLTCFCAPS